MEWPGLLPARRELALLDQRLIKCRACPRLVEWREEISIVKQAIGAQTLIASERDILDGVAWSQVQ